MTDEDFLSESELRDAQIMESKAHSELCAVQSYCLNGGTCYRLQSLGMHYCECIETHEGKRCEMKKSLWDYETMEVNDPLSVNWATIKPVIIVIGGALLCVLLLFCFYLLISCCCRICSQRKGKYRMSAHQRSGSLLKLVIDEKNNDSGTQTSSRTTLPRTRLPACSSTPEQTKPYQIERSTTDHQILMPSDDLTSQSDLRRIPNSTLKQNNCQSNSTFGVEIHSPGVSPSIHEMIFGSTNNRLTLNIPLFIDIHRSNLDCQSPGDSNNNDDSEALKSSSRNNSTMHSAPVVLNRPLLQFGQPEMSQERDGSLLNCVTIPQNSPTENDLLYHANREATAL